MLILIIMHIASGSIGGGLNLPQDKDPRERVSSFTIRILAL